MFIQMTELFNVWVLILSNSERQGDLELQPDNEERITNGQTVAPNSIPWQAFIVRWNGVTRGKNMLGTLIELVGQLMGLRLRSSCGGSLVSSYYAHCVTKMLRAI